MTLISVKLTRDENASLYGVSVGDTVQVELERYVAAVVASEIGNSALEACKAQAVAARTFAVNKGVLEGKTISDSSSTDQAYRANRLKSGLYPNAERATRDTEGETLTWNGKAISAVYSACNGGKTVSSQERWGGVRPYLIAQDDPWDDSANRTGHGVGMSQRGAKNAAEAGKTYVEILSFYYPGTVIQKIVVPENNVSQKKEGDRLVNAKDFVEKVKIPLNDGWGYIYGTWGSIWTQARQDAATREQTKKWGSRWIGKMVTDCSGLIRWALKQLGEDIVHHATYQYTDWCKAKGRLVNGQRDDGKEIVPGTLVFLQGSQEKIHHVGVYIGNNTCVEAKGTLYGVVTSQLSHWDHWGELKMVDYSNNIKNAETPGVLQAQVTNPNRWLNVRSGPGTNYGLVFQVERGSTVTVLAQDGDWLQIQYGSRVGWACADYLTVVEPEEPKAQDDSTDEQLTPDNVNVKNSVVTELVEIRAKLDQIIGRMGGTVG